MVKRVLRFCWTVRYEFLKYTIVGTSGVFIDMGTLIAFKEFLSLSPTTAVFLNQALLMVYNFTLNKYWSFKSVSVPHKQMIRYLTLAVFNYSFSVATMYLFNGIFDFDYRLVRLCTIIVAVSWNFLLFKYWVYKD